MRPGVAVIYKSLSLGPPVEFLKLRHVVGIAKIKDIPRIEGRHEKGLVFMPRPWLCATC
jgi:hypothetical protein